MQADSRKAKVCDVKIETIKEVRKREGFRIAFVKFSVKNLRSATSESIVLITAEFNSAEAENSYYGINCNFSEKVTDRRRMLRWRRSGYRDILDRDQLTNIGGWGG